MNQTSCSTCGQILLGAEKKLTILHPARGSMVIDGVDVYIGPSQMKLLAAMAQASFWTLSRKQLIDVLYWDDEDGGPLDAETALRIHIAMLRKYLKVTCLRIVNNFAIGYSLEFTDGKQQTIQVIPDSDYVASSP